MQHEEIELKFELTPEALERLSESGWFTDWRRPVKIEQQVSVYFDTQQHALLDKKASLRIRHSDGRHIQTIKTPATGLGRNEFEDEVEGDQPKLSGGRARLLGRRAKKLGRQLVPVFETEVERRSVLVDVDDATVELALDRGEIRTGDRSESIHELELELKSGDTKGLVAVARQLGDELPLRYGAWSKAERGHALGAERARAVRAEPVELTPRASVGDAFRSIGLATLRQIAQNEAGLLARDSEALHQLRVGLRRFRAAISIFKPLLGDPESEHVKAEAKWLTEELTDARDLDVFVNQSSELAREAELHGQALGQLQARLVERREKGFDTAIRALQSERYRRFTLAAALWLLGGEWATGADALIRTRREASVRPFARQVLSTRARKIGKHLRRIAELGSQQRHKLRIAVKKFRYGSEFFAELFPDGSREYRALTRVLKDIQDTLGKLHDSVVHESLAQELTKHTATLAGSAERETLFAIGLVRGREDAALDDLLARAARGRQRLRRVPRFWA